MLLEHVVYVPGDSEGPHMFVREVGSSCKHKPNDALHAQCHYPVVRMWPCMCVQRGRIPRSFVRSVDRWCMIVICKVVHPRTICRRWQFKPFDTFTHALKARFLCTQEALRGRMCFSEKPIPFENAGETSSTATGDDVHVDYPQVRTGSSATNRSKSSLSVLLMDDRFLRVK